MLTQQHSFRTFAGDELRTCGLKEKAVPSIVGHKDALAAETHYTNWAWIEEEWAKTCADKMTFLENGAVAQKQVTDLTRTNGKLEASLEKLLERLT